MDLQRIFLFLIFTFSLFSLWDGWQRYQHPESVVTVTEHSSVPSQTIKPITQPAVNSAIATSAPAPVTGQVIHVKTDFLNAEINTAGGDLRQLEFLKHHDTDDKSKSFVLLQQQDNHTYIAQSGLLNSGLPTHNTIFSSQITNYELAEGQDKLEVRLHTTTATGVQVNKVYVFHRSSYLIEIGYEISNGSREPINTSAYFQLVRDSVEPTGASKFVPTYTGPAVYTEKEKFQKVNFSSIDKNSTNYPKSSDNGWIGMLQHYFVAAWLPKGQTEREFFTRKLDNGLYSVGTILPLETISPGANAKISVPLYAGPAQATLDKIAPGLGLTVDYGWLTIIARPIFWTLTQIHGAVLNWGIAIIILTILIKLFFFPLSAASYRSMAKMRLVAPKLEKIKQQYAGDRERLNQAMMELYKTEKINPLGGCLPVLIQIPVFISLYWAILSSVEMRYAPFYGWITDLSRPDPYYVLPLIMGISMVIQGRLNPTPPDPMQAKLMQIMPVIFSVVFFFFPAGLVLYSVINNMLSIAQQWYITRKSDAEAQGNTKA